MIAAAFAVGLLTCSSLNQEPNVYMTLDGFAVKMGAKGQSQVAAKAVTACLRKIGSKELQIGRATRPTDLQLQGQVWTSDDNGNGRGSVYVEWKIRRQDSSLLGVWSAVAPSYRSLISSMPGSGLAQPNGLCGEILESCRRAKQLSKARANLNLRLEVFDAATGRPFAEKDINTLDSRNLRVTLLGRQKGFLIVIHLLGSEIVSSEIKEVGPGRRTVMQKPWNPAHGHYCLGVLIDTPSSGQPVLPRSPVTPFLAAGIQEQVHQSGPSYTLLQLSQQNKVLAWKLL